jgi:NAD(P)H-flavin reductase
MSDSDDSSDSERAFDVEIEKYEKRLQLARYKKKYRNVWTYVTDRWQEKHIHIVLKDIEQKWRVYSAGSHEHLQNISRWLVSWGGPQAVSNVMCNHPTRSGGSIVCSGFGDSGSGCKWR